MCGPAPCDGGTTTLIGKRLGCLLIKNDTAATVDAVEEKQERRENREKKRRRGSRAVRALPSIPSSFTVGSS